MGYYKRLPLLGKRWDGGGMEQDGLSRIVSPPPPLPKIRTHNDGKSPSLGHLVTQKILNLFYTNRPLSLQEIFHPDCSNPQHQLCKGM